MDMAELEDQLAADTDELLASETITVRRNRTRGPLDPSTRTRTLEVGAAVEAVKAINSPRIVTVDGNNRRVVITTWEVLATNLSFTPSPGGRVVAADGTEWKISRVENELNGRKHLLHCVKIK